MSRAQAALLVVASLGFIASIMRLSPIGYLNFMLLQFFGIRLAMEVEDDDSISALNIIGPIVPFTGWWSSYVYVPRKLFRLCVWLRK